MRLLFASVDSGSPKQHGKHFETPSLEPLGWSGSTDILRKSTDRTPLTNSGNDDYTLRLEDKMKRLIRELFKDEDRTEAVLVGASVGIMALGLLVAVGAMLY